MRVYGGFFFSLSGPARSAYALRGHSGQRDSAEQARASNTFRELIEFVWARAGTAGHLCVCVLRVYNGQNMHEWGVYSHHAHDFRVHGLNYITITRTYFSIRKMSTVFSREEHSHTHETYTYILQ